MGCCTLLGGECVGGVALNISDRHSMLGHLLGLGRLGM